MEPTKMLDLPIKAVEESPFNQRKAYKGLEDLAESIKAKGVLQPILVRPAGKGWQLVAGHRRLRASKLAGLETIPATVRDLADDEVIEIQVIENVQRSDVTPLEEAEAYDQLIHKHNRTAADIAAKVGKSVAYVYQRLKLADLPEAAKAAVSAGTLELSVALAIARLPNPAVRKEAAAEVLRDREEYSRFAGGSVRQRMSSSDAIAFVRNRFTLQLKDAGFDLDDATLLPKAGACSKCPSRSKNAPMLFPDMAPKDDLCTSPDCFAAKRDANWKRIAAAAEAGGAKVLDAKRTKDVFYDQGSNVRYESGFANLDAESNDVPGRAKTWKAALGAKLAKQLQPIVAQAPNGEVVHLVDKAKALELLHESGKAPKEKLDRYGQPDDGAERRKRKAKRSASEEAVATIVRKAIEAVGKKDGRLPEVLQWIAQSWIADYGGVAWIKSRVDPEAYKAAVAGAKSAKKHDAERELALTWLEGASIEDLVGVLVEITIERSISEWNPTSDTLTAWCKRYQVDLAALQKKALAAEKTKKGGR